MNSSLLIHLSGGFLISNIGLILSEVTKVIMVDIPPSGVQFPALVVIYIISLNMVEDKSMTEAFIKESNLLDSSSYSDNMFSNSSKLQ